MCRLTMVTFAMVVVCCSAFAGTATYTSATDQVIGFDDAQYVVYDGDVINITSPAAYGYYSTIIGMWQPVEMPLFINVEGGVNPDFTFTVTFDSPVTFPPAGDGLLNRFGLMILLDGDPGLPTFENGTFFGPNDRVLYAPLWMNLNNPAYGSKPSALGACYNLINTMLMQPIAGPAQLLALRLERSGDMLTAKYDDGSKTFQTLVTIDLTNVSGNDVSDMETAFAIAYGKGTTVWSIAEVEITGPGVLNVNQSGEVPLDTDGDGLTDVEEVLLGTDINKADTDGDGVNDGTEVSLGLDPLVPDADRLPVAEMTALCLLGLAICGGGAGLIRAKRRR